MQGGSQKGCRFAFLQEIHLDFLRKIEYDNKSVFGRRIFLWILPIITVLNGWAHSSWRSEK